MKLDGTECGGGAVVLVAVKMDAPSRELLTWALVKVADPGDRVIAIHVLDTPTENTSSVLCLVKTFDSILAVYEGFCNLKQVDLKLKVCRGKSVQKTLVEEAKTYPAAKVVVGTSKITHTTSVRSSVSVAKYCSKKLSDRFSVFAVENGKVVFQRKATEANVKHSQDVTQKKSHASLVHRSKSKNNVSLESHTSLQKPGLVSRKKTRKKKFIACGPAASLGDNCVSQSRYEGKGNSLALVPVQSPGSSNVGKSGWLLLRKMLLRKSRRLEGSTGKKMSIVRRVMRLPGKHSSSSSAVVYPDQRQKSHEQVDGHCSELNGESGAVVSKGLPEELEGLYEKYSSTCRLFSYQELLRATSGFLPESLAGRGGNSHVYRGCLPDGKELAVKVLKPSEYALKEFVLEIDIITSLSHKNIISLSGFCFEDNNLFLVYDFVSRGSLEANLHGNRKEGSEFGWEERYKVAVGVAEALDYLHHGCAQPIIHRDVKSSNILLSYDFEPQLSDFGLASRVSGSSSLMTFPNVAGTFGYLAPEYFMHGKVSDKIDVYAFGVVLLELLSGRKPINSECPKGEESLVMWAKQILKGGNVFQLLDPDLASKYKDNQDYIERMVLAATICIRRAPKYRSQISTVLKLLQGDKEVTEWASVEEELDDECDIQSHLNLALSDLEDGTLHLISSTEDGTLHLISSTDQSGSLEN